MRRGDRAAAARLLGQARELEPRDPWVRQNFVCLVLADRRYEDAIAEVEAALALRPASEAVFHHAQSEAELRLGRRALALAAANRAVRADPADEWARFQLADVLMAIDHLDRAAEVAAEGVQIAKALSPHHYRRQAEIERRRRNPAGAMEFLEQALAVELNEPWALLDLSALRLAKNDLPAPAVDKLPRPEVS